MLRAEDYYLLLMQSGLETCDSSELHENCPLSKGSYRQIVLAVNSCSASKLALWIKSAAPSAARGLHMKPR